MSRPLSGRRRNETRDINVDEAFQNRTGNRPGGNRRDFCLYDGAEQNASEASSRHLSCRRLREIVIPRLTPHTPNRWTWGSSDSRNSMRENLASKPAIHLVAGLRSAKPVTAVGEWSRQRLLRPNRARTSSLRFRINTAIPMASFTAPRTSGCGRSLPHATGIGDSTLARSGSAARDPRRPFDCVRRVWPSPRGKETFD